MERMDDYDNLMIDDLNEHSASDVPRVECSFSRLRSGGKLGCGDVKISIHLFFQEALF